MEKAATILLVEDDPSMLEGMEDLLRIADIGYDVEVFTAADGILGLDVMAEHTPDLIVSDIMMPRMEGYEFLRHVRQNPDWLHIPVIFLTAKGSKQDIHKGRVSGADLYITKPFNSSEFLELVKGQLGRAFQLQSNREQEMNNLKKDILQVLNHEFRTPLTYVTAYYEMLADSVDWMGKGGNFHDHLRGIQSGCRRLAHLIEDFIRIIEIRTGEMQKKFDEQARQIEDVAGLLHKVLQEHEEQAAEKGLTLTYHVPERMPAMWGAPEMIRQTMVYLLDNAIKFSADHWSQTGDEIEVQVTTTPERIMIAVTDEGIGFPPAVREQVFDLFFQYNRGKLEQQGAGIGLTVAKALVELHGGVIRVDSDEGEGSTFTVLLPTVEGALAQGEEEEPAEDRQEALVLVVEDDPHLLLGLQELMEIYEGRYHLHVVTAENGREGLEMLNHHHPDLIVSDIMMPEMGGYEFLQNVRKNPDWVQIPFIFLTARGERKDIHRGRTSGVEEYITKPYDSDELLELVVTQLDRHFQVQGMMDRDLEELKRSILQLITPDFRLPLSKVTEFSDHLVKALEEAQTEVALKESLQGLQSGSIRLSRLVEDFITLAELRTGEAASALALRGRPLSNVGMLLYEAAQAKRPLADEQEVTIDCPLRTDVSPVFGDATLLLQALERFIEIGVRACPENGRQTVSLDVTATSETVDIKMTAPVGTPQVWRDCWDGEEDESDKVNTGIMIVRGYIELHDGRVELHPGAENTVLTIHLPVYEIENPL